MNNIILYKILKFYNFQNIQLDFRNNSWIEVTTLMQNIYLGEYKISSFKIILTILTILGFQKK